ncbi:MAG: general secretion pathway protein GspL [Burkholderiales bacterium]|nr:general secretion pathway protein GspL [Burkholderiales bacterium]
MSILILQLPARSRLSIDASGVETGATVSSGSKEYAYVLSADGETVARHGRCGLAMMPRADTVVAVMAPTDVSWHRVTLPKAPAARLRAALAGMLEESLLNDTDDMHLAVAPQAKVGQPAWVAACDLTWLNSQLMLLEKAKLRVDRVTPAVWPDEPATGYFHEVREAGISEQDRGLDIVLTWSTLDGVASWPLSGGLARALMPELLPPQSRFFATPQVASPAERWLGQAVTVQTQAEHLLQANRSLWNLLQFDLTPHSKGFNAVSDQWRQFLSPQWRAARFGLAALVVAQLLGLNLWAWQQGRVLKQKKAEMVNLLKQAHPQVRVVLDAPVQMRNETDALRAAAGQPGDNDLEGLMGLVASAWPADLPSAFLQYDGTSLTVAQPAGWGAGEIEQFRSKLSATGAQVEVSDGRLTVRRGPRT